MIFFDIDETLLDQRKAEAAAGRHFLAAFGPLLPRPCDLPEFCRHWRGLREKHAPAFLRGEITHQEQRRRRIRELFRAPWLSDQEADLPFASYAEHYRNAWSLFDDVLPCLDALPDRPLGVISNGSAEQQRRKLSQTGILERFEVVVVSEEVGAAKPHADIFHTACRRAGWRPRDCVHVGDRLDLDVGGSCAAGLRGIWLARGRGRDWAAAETIRSLAELGNVLRREEAAGGRACR